MNIQSTNTMIEDYPMLWNIESTSPYTKVAMEIQDEMKVKGVSKRILFDPKDSTWTMLIEIGNMKYGTKVHRAATFKNIKHEINFIYKETGLRKVIAGHICKKITLETKDFKSEIWITDKLNLDVANLFKMLSHCGMVSPEASKGDWYKWKNKKGMILEVSSTEKKSDNTHQIKISEINLSKINPLFFTTKGFKISEIAEGQNCGAPQ